MAGRTSEVRFSGGVVWQPQFGPQAMAVACPADIILYGGARGGGKTDCAIGRQISGALEWGPKWNGLFLRKNYKYFKELRRRIKELIALGLPTKLSGGDEQTNTLRFENGALVSLTAMPRPEMLDFFQGQQFCVARGTRILMGDGSPCRIEALKEGDLVSTLEGPRRVLRVMPPRVDECVEVRNRFGSQVHPVTHPIFSVYGWQSYASLLERYSKGTVWSSQGFEELPAVKIPGVLAGHVLDQAVFERGKSSECRTFSEYETPWHRKGRIVEGNLFLPGRGFLLPDAPQLRPLDCLWAQAGVCVGCDNACVRLWGADRGFGCHCPGGYHLSGGPLHPDRGPARDTLQWRDDADRRRRDFSRMLLDVQGNIPEHTRLDLPMYEHPYDGTLREAVEKTGTGACVLLPHGKEVVYDITVDKANHYISYDTGIVNKNTEVSIEEACQFPFIDDMIEKLKGCLRSPHGVPTTMFLTANPGGPGHSKVKQRFVVPYPLGGRLIEDISGDKSVFIPSKVHDNKILCDNDPKYVRSLESIRDPALRKAWLKGDWNVVAGGFFDDILREDLHGIKPFRIPAHWPRAMGFDWGSAKPFSAGWWAISGGEYIPDIGRYIPRGSLIRIREWYGCARGQSDVGLRMDSADVARRIKEIEQKDPEQLLGAGGEEGIDRIADPAIFSAEDGPPVSEKMSLEGIFFRRADNKRVPGWDSLRAYMRGEVVERQYAEDQDGDKYVISEKYIPRFYVFETCRAFFRTVPGLARDEHDYEDVDTDQEDHIADEARYVAHSRQGKGVHESELPRKTTGLEQDFREIEEGVSQEAFDEYNLPQGSVASQDIRFVR